MFATEIIGGILQARRKSRHTGPFWVFDFFVVPTVPMGSIAQLLILTLWKKMAK